MRSIRTVYLGSFGESWESSAVRGYFRVEILRLGRFTLTASAETADATITGSVGVSRLSDRGPSDYKAFGVLQMVQRSSGRLVWMHEYRDRRLVAPPMDSLGPQIRLLVAQFSQELHRAVVADTSIIR
jgi:hypothetical protein